MLIRSPRASLTPHQARAVAPRLHHTYIETSPHPGRSAMSTMTQTIANAFGQAAARRRRKATINGTPNATRVAAEAESLDGDDPLARQPCRCQDRDERHLRPCLEERPPDRRAEGPQH